MRSLLFAQLFTSTLAFPLFLQRRNPPSYNVVSVDGHDSLSTRDLEPRVPLPEPKAASPSYSVVAVDGAGAAPPAQTETVVTTRLSTIVITQSETPQTIVVTITEAQAAAPTPAANNDATVTQTVTAPSSNNNNDAGATQTRAYDNGMWHTTYYYTTVLPEATATPAPAAPAPAAANAGAAAPQPPSPNDNQPQDQDDTNAAPRNDASDALPGTQPVGGAPARPGPPAGEVTTDADRQAWLEGQWAPWSGEGQGAGQGQDGQGRAAGAGGPSGS